MNQNGGNTNIKRPIQTLLFLLTACSLVSCAEPTYHYHLISFERSSGKVLAEGIGRPVVCKGLFEPGVYIGVHIDIPQDASVFGTLVVTRNEELKAVPLYTWQDETGSTNFGCNGPMPPFAHLAKTKKELVESLANMLERDSGATSAVKSKGTVAAEILPTRDVCSNSEESLSITSELRAGMTDAAVMAALKEHKLEMSGAGGGTMAWSAMVDLPDNSHLTLDFKYKSRELRDKGPSSLVGWHIEYRHMR